MYTVEVDHPDYPAGTVFSVANLPVHLENGKTAHVDQDAADQYKQATGRTVLQGLEGSTGFSVKSSSSKKKGGE